MVGVKEKPVQVLSADTDQQEDPGIIFSITSTLQDRVVFDI